MEQGCTLCKEQGRGRFPFPVTSGYILARTVPAFPPERGAQSFAGYGKRRSSPGEMRSSVEHRSEGGRGQGTVSPGPGRPVTLLDNRKINYWYTLGTPAKSS